LRENIHPDTNQERALAIRLFQFNEIVSNVTTEGTPYVLCAY